MQDEQEAGRGTDAGRVKGPPDPDGAERVRDQIRKLVLMKETGPKSAAWHRARVQTIWRLHRQATSLAPKTEELAGDKET